ncbi:MAG: flippase-like domain-containing protein [Flavobacteriaceae bacterium]|nr:flippase-like domain-containing protein [Flavobacteriaceae bacterium]
MYNINAKYKSFLFFLVKLAIVVGSIYFIYNKLTNNTQLKFDKFIEQINTVLFQNNWILISLLTLTFFNWFFEILKWRTLVGHIKKISFFEATQQSLASLTASLFTPNRIGEYGAKAIYFYKNKRKIMLLNLIGNLNQLTITILFGIVGLIYFLSTYDIDFNLYRLRKIAYLFSFLILIFISNKNKKLKIFGFLKFDKIANFVKKINLKIHLKIFLFSLIRYLIFSHQFYFLLRIFGVETDYFTLMVLIFTLYFIASSIPSIALFDWAIKGSVAIFIFSFIDVSEVTIVTITLLMWLLNFALPSVIGSYFVLTFNKPEAVYLKKNRISI